MDKKSIEILITEESESERKIMEVKICWFCESPFYEEEDTMKEKSRDLCHMTREHRGTAHTHCHLNVKQSYS